MHKAQGHYHHSEHHAHGTVSDHHTETPSECETGNGNTDNNTNCMDGGRYGTISFQANNSLDIFHVLEMRSEDNQVSDETLINVKDLQFDSEMPWVTGLVPKMMPVNVESDTILIHALIKAECFSRAYTLRIYLEYEEAEVLISETDGRTAENRNCDLEPQEIHL